MILTARHAAAITLAASILPAASAEIGQVGDLLPSTSVMVMTAPAAKQTMTRLMDTPLMSFMQRDDVQAQMNEMMTEFSRGLAELLEEDEVDPMTLMPTGAIAVGVYPVVDADARTALPALVIAGDFGDEADRMWERFGTLLTSDEMGDDAPTVEEEEVGGRTVWRIEFPAGADADEMGGMGGMGGMGMMPDPGAIMQDAFGTMWLAREGRHILLTSSASAVRRMYDLADGAPVDLLTGRDDVQLIADRIGSGSRDASFMVLMRDMPTLLQAADQMGMLAVATPILQQYFGRITGAGSGVTIDGDDAMIRQRSFIALPDGKAGFTALMDAAEATMEIPAFVPAEASSYSQFTFEFDGLAPLIRRIANTARAFGLPMGDPNAVEQIEQVVTQFTDTLGRRVHQVQVVQRPIDPDTTTTVMAIECTDVQGMDQFVSMFGANMGFEGRDFIGQRIYSMDPAMMGMMMGGMPGGGEQEKFAVGLGGGLAIMGGEPAVETMLRAVGDARASSLGQDARVRRAMATVGDAIGLVGWGWSDTSTVVQAQLAAQKQQMQEMMEMFADMDPAMRDEIMGGMGPMAALNEMDPQMVESMLGDSVYTLRSVEDGFVFDSWLFAPSGE